jgi:protein SCO1/2
MKKAIILLTAMVIISGCGDKFELNENVTTARLKFINQDSTVVSYPDIIKDRIAVIGFIYTHCPDICPLTTHNMQLAQESLGNSELKDVKFILVSFDPERDTPSVLRKYASVRNMNMNDWLLLTGDKRNIDSLLNIFNVKAFHDDTTYTERGEPEYFMIHTDRISLVDANGNLRQNYKGSTAKPEKIVGDIKQLL